MIHVFILRKQRWENIKRHKMNYIQIAKWRFPSESEIVEMTFNVLKHYFFIIMISELNIKIGHFISILQRLIAWQHVTGRFYVIKMPEKIIRTRPWTQHLLSPAKLYRQQKADIKTPVINTYAKQVGFIYFYYLENYSEN